MIGIDANAVVGEQSVQDSRHVVGRWGLHARNDRGVCFTAWLHQNHLSACNTMFQKPTSKLWTHESWSTGARRQIDYILVDSYLRKMLVDSEACDDVDIKSDHRCVASSLNPTSHSTHAKRKPSNQHRQNPRDLDPQSFNAKLDALTSESPIDAPTFNQSNS